MFYFIPGQKYQLERIFDFKKEGDGEEGAWKWKALDCDKNYALGSIKVKTGIKEHIQIVM